MQEPTESPLVTVAQVAARTGRSRQTAYRLIAHGVLPTIKPGSQLLVPAWALERWLRTGAPVTLQDAPRLRPSASTAASPSSFETEASDR